MCLWLLTSVGFFDSKFGDGFAVAMGTGGPKAEMSVPEQLAVDERPRAEGKDIERAVRERQMASK